MNIKDLLKLGTKILENDEDASLKSKILLSNMLKVRREYLVISSDKEVPENIVQDFKNKIEEIRNGRPIQYITNTQEFMGLNFYVDENVLIPQPDTEVLVEEVINIWKQNVTKKILDICTGSGAIAVSLKKQLENVEVTASDISSSALEIAKKNAKNNDVEVQFICSDMFENITSKFDLIVSNPPYIENSVIKILAKEVQNEPYIALAGGEDGLSFYRIIAKQGKQFLQSNGAIAVEIGYNQKESVMKLFEVEGYKEIYCKKDYLGNNRVVVARI